MRPADLAKSLRPSQAGPVKVAEILRERLRLSDDAEEDGSKKEEF
jgi:hypothetical protein